MNVTGGGWKTCDECDCGFKCRRASCDEGAGARELDSVGLIWRGNSKVGSGWMIAKLVGEHRNREEDESGE